MASGSPSSDHRAFSFASFKVLQKTETVDADWKCYAEREGISLSGGVSWVANLFQQCEQPLCE